mmetsp:Transcript_27789/g.50756  ORF Transcript_27789/g.50756 Transcript_27789/m.50756 type:complete len:347 (+) Transcript_27789:64-1104(+)
MSETPNLLYRLQRRRNAITMLLVLWWYCSAVLCVTSSKVFLVATGMPMLLSCLQMVTSWLWCRSLLLVQGQPLVQLHGRTRVLVWKTASFYAMGFILTNVSISLMNASLAETIKSAEPISSVVLAALYTTEGWPSIHKLISLVPIVLGVALASFADATFVTLGLVAAVGSNFCFSARAMYAKKIAEQSNPAHCMDDLHLFCYVCSIGSIITAVFAVCMDGPRLYQLLLELELSKAGLDWWPVQVAVLNGTMYCWYNLASFMVLSRVQLVTHATLNVIRRCFIIVVATVVFAVQVTRMNVLGVALALTGFAAFLADGALCKRRAKLLNVVTPRALRVVCATDVEKNV